MRRALGWIGVLFIVCVCSRLAGCNRPEPHAAAQSPGSQRLDPGESRVRGPVPGRARGAPGIRSDQEGSEANAADCPRDRAQERERLVREAIEAEGISDRRVLDAMRRVPRHWFVPAEVRDQAYEDRPLSIGHEQTISQPYIVAAMTAAVGPRPTDRCLEIGTGSGYQAAVLAELCRDTYSIEYLPQVARFGAQNLRRCGYGPERVKLRVGDGYRGWPEAAPFDVIVVTAAPERVPQPLLEQLAPGGRLIIPVGPQSRGQELELWTRIGPGQDASAFRRRSLLDVRFVPMLGEAERH